MATPSTLPSDPVVADHISKGEDVEAVDAAVSTASRYSLSVYRVGLFFTAVAAFYSVFTAGAAVLIATAPVPPAMIEGFSLIAPANIKAVIGFVVSVELTYRTWQFWLKLARLSPVAGVSESGSAAGAS